jgi:hypothetical protein
MTNLIPGEAQTKPTGTLLRTEIGAWEIKEAGQGTGTVLIRPDRVQIGAGQGAKQSVIKGTLISSSFSGSIIHLKLEVLGYELGFTCQDSGCELPPVGTEVHLNFEPENALHFFPD